MASPKTIGSSERSGWAERKCMTLINRPHVSVSKVGQELGWTGEEYKSLGVKYGFLRSGVEKNRCPHTSHSLDDLIPFGGLFPSVHVHAGIRNTRFLRRKTS